MSCVDQVLRHASREENLDDALDVLATKRTSALIPVHGRSSAGLTEGDVVAGDHHVVRAILEANDALAFWSR